MHKLIIYLQANSDLLSWAHLDEMGLIQHSAVNQTFDDLTTLSIDKEVIVIIPAEDVLLTQTKMPQLSRHRLRQALPYALEEQVLGDVTDLHFAMGPYQVDETVPVAIIAKQKMDSWLQAFKERDIFPAVFIPASLAPPVTENAWQVVVTPELDIIRTGTYTGYACDKNNLADFVNAQLTLEKTVPEMLNIRNYTTEPSHLGLSVLAITEKTYPHNQLIEDLARWVNKPAINLLQGAYQAKPKKTSSKKIWIWTAYLAAAWVGLIFFGNLISLALLHHQLGSLETSIDSIYKRNFPDAKAIVEPKARMQAKLNALSSDSSHNPLLLWLGYIGKSLKAAPDFHIQQLEYRENLLIVEFKTPNVKMLDAFVHGMTRDGLSIKQQNVSVTDTETKGSLMISAGGKS